ncbi:carbohydrate ABC transporter permease [Massiliimalia massiliensis]|uniref:carbohydrate ABC transporter permease n=1 Tax=Massiliimalia massiliensis TaxID=1852384 RepID=UPI000986A3CB|nr:carbohydrate ABC transporter permease [Massiliimalia massiliensis]
MVGKDRIFQIVLHIVFLFLVLCCLIPFFLLIISSFTDETALIRQGYSFFPQKWSLEAYRFTLIDSGAILRGYSISFVVMIIGTVVNLLLTTLYAYPLSRRDLPGRGFFSFYLFFTMLFNGGLIPTYMMWVQTFHIKNTIFALIVPNLLMTAFYVIMMRTYLSTNIPDAVIEAARIDGAGEVRILAQIVLPMSTPILATLALLVGLGYWNDWVNGLYYINNEKLYSTQVLLNRMLMDIQFLMSNASQLAGAGSTGVTTLPTMSIKMAMAVMGVLPILIIYPFFQKYFVRGIVIGAVKE